MKNHCLILVTLFIFCGFAFGMSSEALGGEPLANTLQESSDPKPQQIDDEDDFIRLMNVGKAYLDNVDAAKAIGTFEKALKLRPKSPEAMRNTARAFRLVSKNDMAIEILIRAKAIDTKSAAIYYLLGLMYNNSGDYDKAIVEFEAAIRLDPITAALRYQLALVYQRTDKHNKAIEQFNETARLDPFHINAQHELGKYARDRNDKTEIQRRLREVKRLLKLLGPGRKSGPKELEKCIHTAAESLPINRRNAKAGTAGIDVSFSDVTDIIFPEASGRIATLATVLEQDDNGHYTIFIAGKNRELSLMKISSEGIFTSITANLKLPASFVYTVAVAGNFYDNVPENMRYDAGIHSLNDMFLIGPEAACLLLRTGESSFEDVTKAAGLSNVKGAHAQWLDYDHDGDLDIMVAGNARLELWQNNGDVTFTNVTKEVGISSEVLPLMVAAVDLDSNNAIDVIVARGNEDTLVFENQRAGRFAPMPQPPGPWPTASKIAVNDLNNDGHPDVLLVNGRKGTILFGQSNYRQYILFPMINPAGVQFIDFDNDGFLDLLIYGTNSQKTGQGQIRLWRNMGGRSDWVDVTSMTGLDLVKLLPVRNVVVADLDHDRDSDILAITSDDRLQLLRNDGGHINGQLQIRLLGSRSNPGGIGTRIEIRDGDFFVSGTVSQVPVEIGLGGRKRLDVLQTIWPSGIVDNQVNLNIKGIPSAVGDWLRIIREPNIDTGSCPFLYVWDGERFRFVTDLLGNSPLGLPLSRSLLLPSDVDEYVVVGDTDNFKPRGGYYLMEVTSEFNEVLYLDSARLIAVDHPPEIEIHSTDKLRPEPFPASELWALGSKVLLKDAVGSNGRNYKTELSKIDGNFTSPGVLLPPPYRGMCYPLSLTLDFGKIDVSRPLVLALTGWLQYGQASGNIAVSQNGSLTIIPPKLEFESGNGKWQEIDVIVGMPAGKTKTILVDLDGRLPEGTRRLRLTTTFEIRWDRIALFNRASLPESAWKEVPPEDTNLHWRGFSEIKSWLPGHPKTPVYENVFQRPPWRASLQGWCTRYGNVDELVAQRDQALVVMNGGDALSLKFAANGFDPVPKGMTRTFFFYTFGWNKDGDYNVVKGDMVYPMPVSSPLTTNTLKNDDANNWQLKYNTRWIKYNRFDPNVY